MYATNICGILVFAADMVPPFLQGHSFFLINHGRSISAPRGTHSFGTLFSEYTVIYIC